jgi:rhodanese-related sulfurtransferase
MHAGKPVVLNKKFSVLLKSLLSKNIPQAGVDFAKDVFSDALFIDVREKAEYDLSTIEGAIHCSFKNFDINTFNAVDKNRLLIVFCSVGFRSEKICRLLLKQGFSNSYNLYGGIFEWVNRKYPLVNTDGCSTDIIHGFSPLWGIWVTGLKKVYD